jgi:hypothetical protein
MACKVNRECPADGQDSRGRCLGACRECDTHLMSTGRYTVYCPSCDTCAECGCPQVDGFAHYADCTAARDDDGKETEQ